MRLTEILPRTVSAYPDKLAVVCGAVRLSYRQIAERVSGLSEALGQMGIRSGEPEVKDDDPANIYYTSGTTGHQKGVVLTHRNIYSHALATIAELQLEDTDVWAHSAEIKGERRFSILTGAGAPQGR